MPSSDTRFHIPKYLSQEETRSFFRTIEDLRDRTLFSLIYHYGLRVSEVSLLKLSDADLVRQRILIRRVKAGVWGEKPIFRSTGRLLSRYIAQRRREESSALFPGVESAPLQKRRIQQLFARYRDRSGLPRRATCHWLRHSIATHLLDAGLTIPFVQDHLGHKNPASTAIYARISDRNRQRAFTFLDQSSEIVHPQAELPRIQRSTK